MYQMDSSKPPDKGQPLNKGQNGQKSIGPKRVRLIFGGSGHCTYVAQLPNYVRS